MIKIGVCRSIDDAKAVYEAGFDYIECGFCQVFSQNEADYKVWRSKLADSPVPCLAMNGMLSGEYRVTGPAADLKPAREFLVKAFERAAEIKLPVVVFGSSGARKIPVDADGKLIYTKEQAWDQVCEYLLMAGDLAKQAGVTIAIEPLNFKEDNCVNSVAEGAEIARRVNHPAVKLLADGYHMAKVDEGADAIINAGADLMRHCHTANPEGRIYPTPEDPWDYKPFFSALKQIGYEGCVSVEAGCKDFAVDGPIACSYLKTLR